MHMYLSKYCLVARAYMQCGLKPTAAAIIPTFDIIILHTGMASSSARGSYQAMSSKKRK